MNRGFLAQTIEAFKVELEKNGQPYLAVDPGNNSDEYFHFQFVGKHQHKDVIFDCILSTLRLEHESLLYELAEEKALERFPNYSPTVDGPLANELEEEVGLYMAEVILEYQESGDIKVQEFLEVDDSAEFGIGLDVGLQVETITPVVIERFINRFNEGSFQLDETLYTFQASEDEEE